MPKAEVKMHVRKASPAVSVIDIQGEINGFAENVLMEAYSKASDSGVKAILLNFDKLAFMNSSGIGLLVTMLIRANRQKQRLMAFGLNDHYKQIFELTRLNEAIAIFDSEAEALASGFA